MLMESVSRMGIYDLHDVVEDVLTNKPEIPVYCSCRTTLKSPFLLTVMW